MFYYQLCDGFNCLLLYIRPICVDFLSTVKQREILHSRDSSKHTVVAVDRRRRPERLWSGKQERALKERVGKGMILTVANILLSLHFSFVN